VHALLAKLLQLIGARVRSVPSAYAVGGGLRGRRGLRLVAGGFSAGVRTAANCESVSACELPGRGEPDGVQGVSRQHLPIGIWRHASCSLRQLSGALCHPAIWPGRGAEQLHV